MPWCCSSIGATGPWGDYGDLNSDQQDHNLLCLPLHYSHHGSVYQLLAGLPTVFFVVCVTTLGVVQRPIEVYLGDIGPRMHNQEIQTQLLSHQELGVTDTRFTLTCALNFHAEARGFELLRLFRAQPFSRRCTAPMAALPKDSGRVFTAICIPSRGTDSHLVHRVFEAHVGIEPTLRLLCRQPLTSSEAMDQSGEPGNRTLPGVNPYLVSSEALSQSVTLQSPPERI